MRVDASTAQRDQLLSFLQLLIKWNNVYNLTAVRDLRDMLIVHLLDSLSILPLVEQYGDATLLDVGSGAGLPGLPIAIMHPALRVTSVDSVAKKIGFQQQVKAALGLEKFHAIHSRVEVLTLSESPSIIVSRAYADLTDMLKSVEHHATSATTIIAMKGVTPIAEIERLSSSWQVAEIRPIQVPFLGAQRCAVVMHKAP